MNDLQQWRIQGGAKKQKATATDKEAEDQEFTRFERDGLLNLEHLGGGSMLEAPPVDWSVEEEFSEGMERYPQDIIDKGVDDFPKCLKKCIEAGGGHFENK
uniref:Uncharacterized protein n=1 Tax=Acrobeloides nanus TaxID=290746 RepID=A0A914CNR3_9BILA